MFNADRCYRSVKERAREGQPQGNRAEVKGNTQLLCTQSRSRVGSMNRAPVDYRPYLSVQHPVVLL